MENPLFQKYVEQINYMLNEASRSKKFSTLKDRMIWERGYLTGLLASLAYQDSNVHLAIRRKINER